MLLFLLDVGCVDVYFVYAASLILRVPRKLIFFPPPGVTSFTCLSVRAGVDLGFLLHFFFLSIQPNEVNIAETVAKRTQL